MSKIGEYLNHNPDKRPLGKVLAACGKLALVGILTAGCGADDGTSSLQEKPKAECVYDRTIPVIVGEGQGLHDIALAEGNPDVDYTVTTKAILTINGISNSVTQPVHPGQEILVPICN
jgi:hypothetical protein